MSNHPETGCRRSRAGHTDTGRALAPFRRDNKGEWWTADLVKSTRTFGYHYPETASANATTSDLRSAVNTLYSGAMNVNGRLELPSRFFQVGAHERLKRGDHSASFSTLRLEYVAYIIGKSDLSCGSYAVDIFLGTIVSEDPADWFTAASFVGTHGVFASPRVDTIPRDQSVSAAGAIPLTSTILTRYINGDLPSLNKTDVETYLRHNLRWRARTVR